MVFVDDQLFHKNSFYLIEKGNSVCEAGKINDRMLSGRSVLVWLRLSYLSTYSGLSHDFLTRHDIQSILNFILSWLAWAGDASFSSMSALVMIYTGPETIDTA